MASTLKVKEPPMPATGGVYVIENSVNGKAYIGSTGNLRSRKNHHFKELKAGDHGNTHLQRAYSKYGPDAFHFRVLRLVPDKTDLIRVEQLYLDEFFGPDLYNIRKTADSNRGCKWTPESRIRASLAHKGKKLTEEQRAKISASLKGQHRQGHPHTEEHKAKLSMAMTGKKFPGRTRGPCSEETKAKMSLGMTGKRHRPHHGRPVSDETRTKMRLALAGRTLSEETKAKMSESQKRRRQAVAA